MGFFSDLLGLGGNKDQSSTSTSNLTDQRAALGEGAVLVRDRAKLTITSTDAGAVRAGTRLAVRAMDSSDRALLQSLDYGKLALNQVAAAYGQARGNDVQSSRMVLVALGALAIVAVMAVRGK